MKVLALIGFGLQRTQAFWPEELVDFSIILIAEAITVVFHMGLRLKLVGICSQGLIVQNHAGNCERSKITMDELIFIVRQTGVEHLLRKSIPK